jgi:hypothetical protein
MNTQLPIDYADAPQNFQRQILMLVIWAGAEWYTIPQLASHVGDTIDALDALSALADAGLVHRQGNYVFPTRPAIHLHNLFGATW